MKVGAVSTQPGTIGFYHEQEAEPVGVVLRPTGGHEATILCHICSSEVLTEGSAGWGVHLVIEILPTGVAVGIDFPEPRDQPAALLQLVLSITGEKESAVRGLAHGVDHHT